MDNITKVIPTVMSVGLLQANLKFLKKKKKKARDFVEMGVGNIVGTAIIKETSDFLS